MEAPKKKTFRELTAVKFSVGKETAGGSLRRWRETIRKTEE